MQTLIFAHLDDWKCAYGQMDCNGLFGKAGHGCIKLSTMCDGTSQCPLTANGTGNDEDKLACGK